MKSSAFETLRQWRAIPRRIRRATRGLSATQLDRRGGSEAWSIREYAHHLIEANLVAATIVVAAVGSPGCRYDWSWMWPSRKWMRRLGYSKAPLEPAIRLLEGLTAHLGGLLARSPRKLSTRVRVAGTRNGRGKLTTVAKVFQDEVDHADHHLGDVAAIRKARS